MGITVYQELSEQEQIKIPSNPLSLLFFNLKTILNVIIDKLTGRISLSQLERKLISDESTFFNHHIQRHSKYDSFVEFGDIYNLIIPKHDSRNLDLNSKDPILIFIHGLGGNLHQFDEQFNHFYQKFDVISFDLPGSGNSKLADVNYKLSLHNFTRFVIEFLEFKELNERDFILVGHSYGTQVIINLIHHLNPKQIKKIILIAPPKFPNVRTFQASLMIKTFSKLLILFEIFRKFDRINNIKSNSMKRLFSVSKFDDIDDFLKFKQFKFNLQTNSRNFLNHVINWEPVKLDELITSINHLKTNDDFKKIFIIDGAEDQVTKDGGSSYKAILGEDVEYHVIPRAGHNLLLDSYEELNILLDEGLLQ